MKVKDDSYWQENYYTTDDLANMFNVPLNRIGKYTRNGNLKVFHKYNSKKNYYLKEDIDNYLKSIENCISVTEVIKKYRNELSQDFIYYKINSGKIPFIKSLVGKNTYVHISDIELLIQEKNNRNYNKDNYSIAHNACVLEISNSEIEANYYSTKEIFEIFHCSFSSVNRAINEGRVTLFIKKPRAFYFQKQAINEHLKMLNENYITIKDAIEKYNLNKNYLKDKVRYGTIHYIYSLFNYIQIYLLKDDIEACLLKIEKDKLISNSKTLEQRVEIIFNGKMYSSILETCKLYVQFTKERLNRLKTKNIQWELNNHFKAYETLMPLLDKNLFLYNNSQIYKLIESDLFNSHSKLLLNYFITYCHRVYGYNCGYNLKPTTYTNKQNSSKKINDIYDKSTWLKYLTYLIDIDKHIYKAFESDMYANYWLFTLLHLSLFWRKSDITSIPILHMPLKDITGLEWFEKNTFFLSNAQLIIDAVDFDVSDLRVSKTGTKVNFVIPLNLLIPTAVAFICCNQHATLNNRKTILRPTAYFKAQGFIDFFRDVGLDGFSSLKANRTLSSLGFDSAVHTEGMAHLAYSLNGDMRSHMINARNLIQQSTSVYIYDSTGDYQSANDVSYNLFLRGHFGELYYLIALIAYSNINKLRLEEVTEIIQDLRERLSPIRIENISELLLYTIHQPNNDIQIVIEELLSTDKSVLKEKLELLFKYQLPSRMSGIQCLNSPSCIKPIQSDSSISCIGCRYSLPSIYMLKKIESIINNLLNKLSCVDSQTELERKKYSNQINRCLNVILAARNEYSLYNNDEFIETLVDLKSIRRKIKSIMNK